MDLHTLPQPDAALGEAAIPPGTRGSTLPSFGHLEICHLAICPSGLLSASLDPSLSLLDIAAAHNLTLDQLTAWMARPDVAEQLAALHSAAALRVRIVAANHLPRAVEALGTIINASLNNEDQPTLDRTNFRHLVFRQRRTETVRRAASTILRLANFYPPVRPAFGGSRPSSAIEVGPPTSMLRSGGPAVPAGLPSGRATVPAAAPLSPAASLHRDAVEVNSRGLPRSGTPGIVAPQSPSSHAGLHAPCANAPSRATSVPIHSPRLGAASGSVRSPSPSGSANGQPPTPRRSLASRLLAACGNARASGDP
ncbi:MAG: hypothetical protein ACKVS8_08125 [Phycisphaerales bacterium]